MSSSKSKRSRPLFTTLMWFNLVAGLLAIGIGCWLVLASQFSYSSSIAAEAISKYVNFEMPHKEQIWLVNHAYLFLLIIGILTITVGFFMLWNAADIFLLITNVGKNIPVIRDYKKHVKEEMVTLANGEATPENGKKY